MPKKHEKTGKYSKDKFKKNKNDENMEKIQSTQKTQTNLKSLGTENSGYLVVPRQLDPNRLGSDKTRPKTDP